MNNEIEKLKKILKQKLKDIPKTGDTVRVSYIGTGQINPPKIGDKNWVLWCHSNPKKAEQVIKEVFEKEFPGMRVIVALGWGSMGNIPYLRICIEKVTLSELNKHKRMEERDRELREGFKKFTEIVLRKVKGERLAGGTKIVLSDTDPCEADSDEIEGSNYILWWFAEVHHDGRRNDLMPEFPIRLFYEGAFLDEILQVLCKEFRADPIESFQALPTDEENSFVITFAKPK